MNKIKEKFPEICYFIENPKEYELLYYKEDDIHNEYALDVVEAKRIINTIESLQKENQELKKQLEEYKLITIDYQELQGRNEDYETQQKEFIKYLEDEINKEKDDLEKLCELYNISKENDIAYKFFYSYINKLEKILKKYNEIIGDDK